MLNKYALYVYEEYFCVIDEENNVRSRIKKVSELVYFDTLIFDQKVEDCIKDSEFEFVVKFDTLEELQQSNPEWFI